MNEYERYEDYTQQTPAVSGRSGTGTALTFLLIGVGIGAAAALLFTPMSGSELRANISRGYRSTVDGIGRGTRRLRERSSNLLRFNRGRNDHPAEQYRQG